MRRPNVYERSAPRAARSAYREPTIDHVEAARAIAEQLGPLIAKAEAAGQSTLADLLDRARREADTIAVRKV